MSSTIAALPPELLAAILDKVDDHLVCYDAQWRYVYVNAHAAKVLGRSQQELLGHCIWDLFPDAVGNDYYQDLQRARREQRPATSEVYYAPFGRWFRNQIYPSAEFTLVRSTDITERKRAEEDLHATANKLRLATQAAGLGVFVWNVQEDTARWENPRMFEIFERDPAEGALSSAAFFAEVIHPEDAAGVRASLSAAVTDTGVLSTECRIRRRNGEWRFVRIAGQIDLQPSGGPSTFLGVVEDIDERKAAENDLRRKAERQRLLVALQDSIRVQPSAAAVLWETVHLVGRFFAVTRCSYAEIDPDQEHLIVTGGYRVDVPSVAGRHRLSSFGPAVREQLSAGQALVVSDIETDPRTRAATVQAAYAAMQARSMICVPLMREGAFAAMLVMLHREPRAWSVDDVELLEQVAERTWFAVANARAEAQLRESRNVLELAIRGGRMGAWSRNLRTDQVWWSPELESIFGYQPGEFDGTYVSYARHLHPDDREPARAAIHDAIAANRDYVIEFRFRHTQGEWRWMEGRGRAVYEGAEAVMVYGIGLDITERKAAQAELLKLNAQLSETDRRRNDFLATLAHELRNPLAPIGHAASILLKKQLDDPDLVWIREVVDRQLKHM